jgi:hypothetical protein
MQLDLPERAINTIDTPTFGVARSDAHNRSYVADVCELVARMIAKLLISKEICSIGEFRNFPLRTLLTTVEERRKKDRRSTHLVSGLRLSVCARYHIVTVIIIRKDRPISVMNVLDDVHTRWKCHE